MIAGGGIAGLSMGLACHQIGIPFKIFETASEIKPMGVGINVQPNAVRELFELGLENQLSVIGIKTKEFGTFTKKGLEVWKELRGTWVGYKWSQYSVYCSKLLVMLYENLIKRAGNQCIEIGWKADNFINHEDNVTLNLVSSDGSEKRTLKDTVLIGVDGIHSNIRSQIILNEGDPFGVLRVLWRGITTGKPFLSGSTMIMIGQATRRFVAYPISNIDKDTDLQRINWIAELSFDPTKGWKRNDWNREAHTDVFLPNFLN